MATWCLVHVDSVLKLFEKVCKAKSLPGFEVDGPSSTAIHAYCVTSFSFIICVYVKEVDAIIDKQGNTVTAEIHGYIGNAGEAYKAFQSYAEISFRDVGGGGGGGAEKSRKKL
jgi:hypothetical protein